MKTIIKLAFFCSLSWFAGCVAPKPMPDGLVKVEATYFGYYKSNGRYVLKYYTKLYDTVLVYQSIRPRFRMRDQVYLEWNCSDSLSDVKILKNR